MKRDEPEEKPPVVDLLYPSKKKRKQMLKRNADNME